MLRTLVTLILLAAIAQPAMARESYAFGFSPRTGDTWMDARLGDLNVHARGNMDGFIDDVVVSYGAPRHLVREYVVDRRWAPGDVYYACAIAHALGMPCLRVIEHWERGHGRGWGVIAQELGIKPGSPEFHALKNGMRGNANRGGGRPAHAGPPPGRGHGEGNRGRGNRGN